MQGYLQIARRFLTRLALLVYILGGQPPRGTELFSIRFRNTMTGGARNLYINHGLVSFVTSYHKRYSIEGSLKLIHRYLSPQLSQILVQYLVLIRPFVEQLNKLVFHQSIDSPFLWAHKGTTWNTAQLSGFFATESARELGPDSRLVVSAWRHIAIAVSREFLPKGVYFDREADKETMSIIDQQAGHCGLTAATIYGRLVEEGHGQIRQFRERYRCITRRWQSFWLDTPVPTSIQQSLPGEIEGVHPHRFNSPLNPPREKSKSPLLSGSRLPDRLLDIPSDLQSDIPSDISLDLPTDVLLDLPTDILLDNPSDLTSDPLIPEKTEVPEPSSFQLPKVGKRTSLLSKDINLSKIGSTILEQQRLLQ